MNNTNKTIRVSWKEKDRKIFGAFKWNAYVAGMYEDIFEKIKSNHPEWEAQYGSKFSLKINENWDKGIKPEEIEEFINRNKQLYEIFVRGISTCDLFIADITNHNPNVLLELGIAIQMDKNILMVTSQDIKDMAFDIRGYEAKKYNSKDELYDIIEKEIQIFERIRNQTFAPGKYIESKRYISQKNGIIKNKEAIKIDGIQKLKNLRIKLDFKFIYSTNSTLDWFGVHLRSQNPMGFFSELALVRHSGKTRSVTWPEQRKEEDGEKFQDYDPTKWCSMEILIDESKLSIWIHQQLVLEDQNLLIENFGDIFIRCNDHRDPIFFGNKEAGKSKDDKGEIFLEVEYRNIEILDLSTTSNLFEP